MAESDQDAPFDPRPAKGLLGYVPGTVDEFINWVLSITEDFERRSFPSPDEWARIIAKQENEPPGWAHVLPPRETRVTRGASEIVTLTWAAERITRNPAGDLIATPLGDLMQIKATPVPTARVQIDEFVWTEHIHYAGGIIRHLLNEELLPQIYELPGFVVRITRFEIVKGTNGMDYIKTVYGPGKTKYVTFPTEPEPSPDIEQQSISTAEAAPTHQPALSALPPPHWDEMLDGIRAVRARGKHPDEQTVADELGIHKRTLQSWHKNTSWHKIVRASKET